MRQTPLQFFICLILVFGLSSCNTTGSQNTANSQGTNMVQLFPVRILEPISSKDKWIGEVKGRVIAPVVISGQLVCPDDALIVGYQLNGLGSGWLINLEAKGVITADGSVHMFSLPTNSTISGLLKAKFEGRDKLRIESGVGTMFRPSAARWPIKPWPVFGVSSFEVCNNRKG